VTFAKLGEPMAPSKKRTSLPRPKRIAVKTLTASREGGASKKRTAKRRSPAGKIAASATTVKMSTLASPQGLLDPAIENLAKIDHIVVLMLENRSFDHLMGYLKLENFDVDGLTIDMANSFQGTSYPVHLMSDTAFAGKDPCHSGECVVRQLQGNNGGFVADYAKVNPQNPSIVMGYYNGSLLPVYDHLAKRYCICDRWFSSVDGSTWPNRLYSVTGRSNGSKDNKTIPLYSLPSFVRHLDRLSVSWNWYSHDIATLRLVDPNYRIGRFDRFRYFEHTSKASFLKDAAEGGLPAVSWIDPDFSDFGFTGNDDHPPADLKEGQELVLKAVHAVTSGPQWQKTVLIILYDEHGGLFDHVTPRNAEDNSPKFRRYGVRVPAFIVSPWVEPGLPSHMPFDHTSLIKTILMRFCRDAQGRIPDMGKRVMAANHLGSVLPRIVPQEPVDFAPVVNTVASWQSDAFKSRLREFTLQAGATPQPASELQSGLARARKKLEQMGLPAGQL
jgi:phospholipase C